MSDAPIRELDLDAARSLEGLPGLAATPAAGTRVLVLEGPDGPRAAAVLDPHGGVTEPDHPWLHLGPCGAGGSGDPLSAEELTALARAGLTAAARGGHDRVVTGCDPLDLTRLRALEAAGFAPTGRQPYFPRGGGFVEYVMGYTDAAGATMDLAATPGPVEGAS